MTTFAPELRSHCHRVCTLYKTAMRLIEGYYVKREVIRYHQVLLRAEFDKHKCECDPHEQRRLYWAGMHEVFLKKHPLALAKFSRSVGLAGGVAAGRIVTPPDWVLDYWHPIEKAVFPDYFERREKRKCEYIEHWNNGTLM